MSTIHTVSAPFGAHPIIIETGKLASLADGAVTVRYGDTLVIVTAVSATKIKEGQDFFPLTVEYRERAAAVGKIPGGYFKREGRPSEKEILTCRMTDRPLRPLFPKGYLYDTQIITTLLSADGENDPDILSINGASAALMVSDIPFGGPIGALRVGRVDGKFVTNPTHAQMELSDLDLVYVATETEILMIEGSALELPETDFKAALAYAQEEAQIVIRLQKDLAAKVNKAKRKLPLYEVKPELVQMAYDLVSTRIEGAIYRPSKVERYAAVGALKDEVAVAIKAKYPDATGFDISSAFDQVQIKAFRAAILDKKQRSDGRGAKEIRPLSGEVGLLPRSHGSSLFARGETQALCLATLAPSDEAQDLDGYTGGEITKRFILHYNFPPFSVGETGRVGGLNRREIGHGALAERSLLAVIPSENDFPYAIRVTSEIMASNGSTSMASVCGGCLALMDAGVPIIAPVAGISCGLMTENSADGSISKWATVTDILGEEDHFGDMDFKLAGTTKGITGFQLDLKINGLPFEIAKAAIYQARDARIEILRKMLAVMPAPRADLSKYAPRIQTIQIDPEKIGLLIGPGGKTIRRITETTGAQIDIAEDDSGKVFIYSNNADAMNRAMQEIDSLCGGGQQIEVGKLYQGRVTGIKDFGCFVECLPGKEGLVHISELADFRVRRTEDVVKMGDMIWVKCVGVDERTGKVRLSRKAAVKEMEPAKPAAAPEPAATPSA